MPSLKSAVSTSWFARVDGDVEFLRPKVLAYAQCLDVVSLLVTHHKGEKKENPHIHMVIQMATSVQKQTYALRLKKHFEVVDRGYALDVWDGRRAEYGAASYLFHEDQETVLVSKLWESSEIQEAQRIARVTNEAVKAAKDKASTKFIDKALHKFEGKSDVTKYEIFTYMMQLVGKKELYWPGTFKSKQMVEEVEIKLASDITRITHEYYANIFR